MNDYSYRIGEKYVSNEGYSFEIIDYFSSRKVSIRFIEIDLIVDNLTYGNIIKGAVKNPYHPSTYNVGYLGQGVYKASNTDGELNFSYLKWTNLLLRVCDAKELERNPTYKKCSIFEKWYNFQNFAQWFEENYNPKIMKGWQLDKDILIKGNKVYSPETCCFVPAEINMLFTNRQKNKELPRGVSYNPRNKCYAAIIYKNRIITTKSPFITPEEAFIAHKKSKENRIKEIADKWKPYIKPNVYEAMYNYQVEITD